MRYMPSGNSGSIGGGRIDYRDPANNGPFYPGTTRQEFRDDPNWRYQHTPGSDRGAHTGFRPPTPSQGGPVGTPESDAAWEEMRQRTEREAFARRGMPFANMQEWKDSDPQYVALRDAFKNATDPRAKAQALKAANSYDTQRQMQFKDQNALNAFIAQGGTEETYRNRFDPNNNWPKPRSPLGAYSHGPGSADWGTRFTNPPPPNTAGVSSGGVRRGATPQANAPMSAGMPPSQNPMFQGYQGGGMGVPSGGSGNWGPGGGMPMGGGNPFAGTGGGETGMMYNMPMDAQSRTMPPGFGGGFLPPDFGQGGRQPINPYNPQPFNPGTRPGSVSQWANMQPGYTPFDPGNFSMPYDQFSGMGFW